MSQRQPVPDNQNHLQQERLLLQQTNLCRSVGNHQLVERSLGREMFSISKTNYKAIANWLACLVVSATVQFHPSCVKLEPYFRNMWSENLADIDECKDASQLIETIAEKAALDNLEWDFKNTPVHPSKPNSWQANNSKRKLSNSK